MSPARNGRRCPGRTAPRSASKEWSANAQIVGHEQLGFDVGPVAHAGVLDGDFEVAARNPLTAPAVAIAVAEPPTQPKPPKPRESTTSTPKNGTVLHDSACFGVEIASRCSDEASSATDASGATDRVAHCGSPRERDFLKVPPNRHQIPIRIGPTSHTWATCDCWQSRQAYRAYMCQGLLAEWADCAGSPNGADPWPFRAHELDGSADAASWKLHFGPREHFRRPSAPHRRHFDEQRAVSSQEATVAE
jgi:hypothetical protein